MEILFENEREEGLIDSYLENIRIYQRRINDRYHELGALDERIGDGRGD